MEEDKKSPAFPVSREKADFPKAGPEKLRNLPTPVRRKVDASNISVPEGYEVEPVMVGFSFPTDICFGEDGTIFVSEGGSSWPTRPYMPARIIVIKPSGETEKIKLDIQAGPRGVSYYKGKLYISAKGGYHTRFYSYDLETGELKIVVDGIPSGGWHEPGGPVFGPDGLMYFGQGSVSQQGVSLPPGFTVDLAKHPFVHDVPGEDVTLTGNNIWSRDPRLPYPFLVETGAYKPFGVPAEKGEKIKGAIKCSSGVWRSKPDGSEMELLAWGIRNPYGMAINEAGELYVSDNDFEDKGERAIANDPDRIWHIQNAKEPHGSIKKPSWYGFPDICGDGLPAWHEKHLPSKGKAAKPLLENPPEWAGPAAFLEEPHSCMTKMDFCKSETFGHKGELFACEWGTLAPLNTPDPKSLTRGFKVIRVDVEKGTAEPFFKNNHEGPASFEDSGGLERPVSCKFSPDGKSLYVLDFGVVRVTNSLMMSYAHTGVLWKITKKEEENEK